MGRTVPDVHTLVATRPVSGLSLSCTLLWPNARSRLTHARNVARAARCASGLMVRLPLPSAVPMGAGRCRCFGGCAVRG